MPIEVLEYVSGRQTVIVVGPDDSEGPYLPLSEITNIGFALITALTSALARAAIGAAAAGTNADITALVGMDPVTSAASVVTPGGTLTMALLAALLGVPGSAVEPVTGPYTVQLGDGVIQANTDGGAFPITIPVALSPKVFFVVKTGSGAIPLTLQTDAGASDPALTGTTVLINGGQAFAIVVVANGGATANGVQ